MSKTEICSFSVVLSTKCGPNRGDHDTVFLRECCSDISSHLRSCHLSREKMTEVELILARAGLFDLGGSKVKEMNICPTHRNNLGRYWQPPRTCQYPEHTGKIKRVDGDKVINLKTSREIYTVYGETAQVGSRELLKCFYSIFKYGLFVFRLSIYLKLIITFFCRWFSVLCDMPKKA